MQDLPTVTTEVTDTANRVRWQLKAYRTVTEQEARAAITAYLRQNGAPKPNDVIEISTLFGLHD